MMTAQMSHLTQQLPKSLLIFARSSVESWMSCFTTLKRVIRSLRMSSFSCSVFSGSALSDESSDATLEETIGTISS
jgi:hypothetical protein